MNKQIKFILIALSGIVISSHVFAGNINCEDVVKHNFSILIKWIDENKSEEAKIAARETFNSAKTISEAVNSCKKEIKTMKGAEKWMCFDKSISYDETVDCTKK